ncbi:MAG: polyketide cyclase [Anaerolineae bacterium]|nr:polyketide cyclase [Anaerolineae bacterium]
MATNEYQFITHWRIQSTIEEISDVLGNAPDLVRWWPSVYLEVQELEPGNPDTGVGKVISLYTKGWLPYTLRWQFRVTENRSPHGFSLEAWGDFVGRGVWTFDQDGSWVNITYDWRIVAEKPLLRHLSFAMKPIFSANHHWAMGKGEESLKLELQRRQAKTDEERTAVPPPPKATFVLNGR